MHVYIDTFCKPLSKPFDTAEFAGIIEIRVTYIAKSPLSKGHQDTSRYI